MFLAENQERESNNCLLTKNNRSYLFNHLKDCGVRIGDSIVQLELHKRKKSTQLNRTCYSFYGVSYDDKNYYLNDLSSSFYIKNNIFKNKTLLLEMTLELENSQPNNAEVGRYLLKSKTDMPFNINGFMSHSVYLERGDKILFFENIFEFKPVDKNEFINPIDEILLKYKKIWPSEANILIEGETGTGKTYLAEKIHQMSERNGPFVHLNLSSFAQNLVESELFGHVKGAFTDALMAKNGAFLVANWGTIFLDEIDSLSLEIQLKLLLFLESKVFRPVGGDFPLKANVRLIFATGRPLEKLVRENIIREDFFFRINSGLKITLSPLRNSQKFIKILCSQFEEKNSLIIDHRLVNYYQTLNWPGNVRQLLSHLEKKRLFCNGKKIIYDEHDNEINFPEFGKFCKNDDYLSMDTMRSKYAEHIFISCGGNLKACSKILDISTQTLKKILYTETV